MEFRSAEPGDGDAIGSVVGRSLRASYALSPEVIDEIVAGLAGEALADRLDDGGVYQVAVSDGEVVGFAQGRIADDGVGEVVWLHVAPEWRGEGAGTPLFEGLCDSLGGRGAHHVRALVLADNEEGDEFAERFDLRRLAETEVERAGVELTADVYADDEAAVDGASRTRLAEDAVDGSDDATVDVPDSETEEGRTVYLGGDDSVPGDEAPFVRTYTDAERAEHYGYYCTNCGSTATAVDELERIECETCGNVHRANEWDAAYL